MRRVVEALFHDPSYPADDAYVQRRYEHRAGRVGGARGGASAAGFGAAVPSRVLGDTERITVPTLVVEGECDKLLPPGWAADPPVRFPRLRRL